MKRIHLVTEHSGYWPADTHWYAACGRLTPSVNFCIAEVTCLSCRNTVMAQPLIDEARTAGKPTRPKDR